ncbi:MAG TPA: complex I subunit 1 family protein [Candidatus Limnocylindrales bacterium]|nr:complex I subunit 1 family protein [Candidatus Limnocylindrales bacterium]
MEFIAQHPVLVVSLVKIVILLVIVMTILAYLSWFERKIIAHIQSRWGPYYVGTHGLLQPLADGVKFLFKEHLTPPESDKFIYTLAPFLALSVAMTTLALIPFGPGVVSIFGHETHLVVANVDIGLLYLFAITSLGVYGVALAGWSSNSKYSLLGGLRSSAQMISYEVSLTLSVVGVVLLAGTFNFSELVTSQQGYYWHFIPRWRIGPQIVGFLCYFTAAIAETNRAPFDLPEGEQELVGGFHTEYSSFKFAMFFMAEYANMVTVSCLATILFLGGWLSPFPERWTFMQYLPAVSLLALTLYLAYDTAMNMRGFARIQLAVVTMLAAGVGVLCMLPGVMPVIQGPFWFTLKMGLLLFFYVWTRSTLPRLRYDQLMSFGWKLLLPVSLLNLLATAAWFVWGWVKQG